MHLSTKGLGSEKEEGQGTLKPVEVCLLLLVFDFQVQKVKKIQSHSTSNSTSIDRLKNCLIPLLKKRETQDHDNKICYNAHPTTGNRVEAAKNLKIHALYQKKPLHTSRRSSHGPGRKPSCYASKGTIQSPSLRSSLSWSLTKP